ncbi:unnamed protein product [Trypanosoma congolense IL3000]|uniref:WGS project CAEQ00000000 data, annotated contig 1299 n=1 Tax=Trypanosoma congolense (strain IL3000) TaxID=1068625 RepID=F9W5A3_TRYCI|nr:unnamed protein product [Trypanosoma congolense IL3000]
MRQVAICGQKSLGCFKYAQFTGFLKINTHKGGVFDMFVSAVSFLEGFDNQGVPFPVDLFGSSSLKCGYDSGGVNEAFAVSKTFPLSSKDAHILEKDISCSAPTLSKLKSVEMIKTPRDATVPVSFFVDIPHGLSAAEVLLCEVLKNTNTPEVTAKIMTVFLASGITIPREFVVLLIDRLAAFNESAAHGFSLFLEFDICISGYLKPREGNQTKVFRSGIASRNEFLKSIDFDLIGGRNSSTSKTNPKRNSRLQSTRNGQ